MNIRQSLLPGARLFASVICFTIFGAIKKHDILMHHPFESFSSSVEIKWKVEQSNHHIFMMFSSVEDFIVRLSKLRLKAFGS